MAFRDTPIQRKLAVIILLTSAVGLLLIASAFFAYEYLTFRQTTKRQVGALGKVIAASSSPGLAFLDQNDAEETLSAFEAEKNLVAAALYDEDGTLFSRYPTNLAVTAFPETLGSNGYKFIGSYLTGFEPVVQKDKKLGTLYLKFDTGTIMRQWLQVAGVIGIGVFLCVLLVTYLVSRKLQQQISQPILALAETARAISARRDYSVRAVKLSEDELGLLTDAFNQMLTQIQEQNQALHEGEARVRSVLNSALSAVVVIDAASRIIDWNERAERMFGWTRAEALGLVLGEIIIPPRFREAHQRGMERYLATGEGPVLNRPIELHALRRDQTEFPVELSISPMKAGDVVAFCGFITDITERKRQEEMRARFVAIVQSSDDAILSKTLDGIITSWNPGAERLFGYATGEVLGQPVLMLIPPERAEEESGILKSISRGERIAHLETVRIRKNGTLVDVSASISPIKDNYGKTIGISTIARDITERKHAEQRVLLQATALETAANGIVITDRNGDILWTNPAFSALTGYAADEVIGKNLRLLKSGKHDLAFYKTLWSTILKGMTWRGSFTNRRKDGSFYQDEHTITPVRSQDGTITHFIAIMQDVTERNQAQRVLRKSEAQLRLVWENSLDGMRLVDGAGVIRMVNSAYCHMIGKSREALEGQPMSVLYEAHRQEEVLREHRERFQGHNVPKHSETEVTLWNGRRIILEMSNSFLEVEDQPPLLFSTFRDITERKQAGEELRRQHHLLRTLIDQLPDYIYVKDSQGRFVVANPAVTQIMGAATPEDLLGKTDADFYPHEESAKYQQDEARVFRGEALINKEEPHIGQNGQQLEMLTTKVPLRDGSGKIIGLVGIGRDITKSKQAEKREAAFARLGQSLSAVATLDAAARLIADAADALFGWDACTVDVYVRERDLVHPVINIDTIDGQRTDVPPEYVDRPPTPTMRRVLEQGAQLLLREDPEAPASGMIPFGDTGRRSASLMHVPIRRGQKVIGILSIQSYTPRAYDEKTLSVLQNLADQCAGAMERVRAEEDLRRLNEELEQRVRDRTVQLEAANKELEAFSYSVSHDLRAPLRHIDGFSEMLRKEATAGLSAPGLRYLGIISHSAKRMGALIDDLLVFSRMGRAALRPARVKMNELVAEALHEMATDLQGRNIQWDIGPLPAANVDRALFKQVWVNLLSNSVKYTRHRAEAVIRIHSRQNGQGELEFSIQDNGAGFDMTFAGKLFGVFQRLHQAEEFEGTGIGLANVRRVVTRHGGRTWAEGKVDSGATFYFTLPDTNRKSA